jgi:hypothetical protein
MRFEFLEWHVANSFHRVNHWEKMSLVVKLEPTCGHHLSCMQQV